MLQNECGELINRNYPALRISLPYADPAHQSKLLALYGLLATVEESLYRASDPVVSHAKLSWWHAELLEARRGNGTHPLSLQLQSSGALAAWPESLIGRMFMAALGRADAAGISHELELQQLCESLGWIHLEMEFSLQNLSVPDQQALRELAMCNGLFQLFRESFKAPKPTYYWVPLSICAELNVSRTQISENPGGIGVRPVWLGVLDRVFKNNFSQQDIARLAHLPGSWAASSKHWLLFSLLQQRNLLRLKRDLAKTDSNADIKTRMQQIQWGDSWFAWRAARQLRSVVKAGKS